MRIAFVGAQGTGKTTLVNEMAKHYPDFVVYDEVVRSLAKDHNVQVNRDGTSHTQCLITQAHLENITNAYFKQQSAFFDRCIIDSHSYAWYQYEDNRISKQALDFSNSILDIINEMFPYDLIVYVPPIIDLVEDGFRDTDSGYRDAVDEYMMRLLDGATPLGQPYIKNVHKLQSKTIEDRVDELSRVMKSIGEHDE